MTVEVRAAIAGALLVAAMVLTGCSQPASTPTPAPAPAALPDPVVLPIEAESFGGGAVAVSADSSRIFVSRNSAGSTDGGLDVVDAGSSTVLGTLAISGDQLIVSPDGKWLFVDGYDGILPVDLATHLVQDVLGGAELGASSQLDVSPDSRRLLITSMTQGTPAVLRIVDLGSRTETGSLSLPGQLNTETSIEFSPDGRLAYLLGGEPAATQLLVVDLETREVTQMPLPSQGQSLTISPDGRRLYVRGWQGMVVIDPQTRSVVNQFPAGDFSAQPVISPNGRYLFLVEPQRNAVTVLDTADGATVTTGRLTVGQGEYLDTNSVAAAPDGRRLYVLTGGGLAVFDTSAFA